jgi:hypothetical protein
MLYQNARRLPNLVKDQQVHCLISSGKKIYFETGSTGHIDSVASADRGLKVEWPGGGGRELGYYCSGRSKKRIE